MFNVPGWGEDDDRQVRDLLDVPRIPGVEVRRSRYALTGPRSWTIVPNTDACVADVLHLAAETEGSCLAKSVHWRTKMWYTFLNSEGAQLDLEFLDCRRDSSAFGVNSRFTTTCDPRFSIAIEPGVAYSIRCKEDLLVRAEQELFVDENEPRDDLPIFGQDLLFVGPGQLPSVAGLPKMPCSAELLRLVARHEIAAFSHPA